MDRAAIGFFDLLILLFIVAPILEGIFGKKARDKRRQLPRQPGGPRTPGEKRQGTAGSASDMVPDDLWELLTGQKRTATTAPAPAGPEEETGFEATDRPLEAGDRPLESWDADLEPAMEPTEYEPLDVRYEDGRVSTPPAPWEAVDEGASLESTNLPEAYSLEQPVPTEKVRHAAFHRRLDALPPPARTRRKLHPDLKLETAADLRRAVILKEVLGTPKGFE